MNNPKVSIIIPVYNVENYLSRCIDSLLNQTLKDIEIILVDDGSSDSSADICDMYASQDTRVKAFHMNNGGPGFARNCGLKAAIGRFIAFVDSDDYVDVKMYEVLYNQAKDFDLDTVYCGFNKVTANFRIYPINEVSSLTIFDNENDIQGVLLDMIGSEPNYTLDFKYQMSASKAIYSKEIIDKFKVKFYAKKRFLSEDLIFNIDYLQKAKKVAFMPNPMYYYCDNFNSSSRTKTYNEDQFQMYVELYKEICYRLPLVETKNRANRLLIANTRILVDLLREANVSLKDKIRLLKSISENVIWTDIYTTYEYQKLPFYQYVVFIFMKKKMYHSLILLSRLKKTIKKYKKI